MENFLYAIRNTETKRHYVRRLENFFDYISLEGTLEQKSKSFLSKSCNNDSWVYANVMKFISYQKERAERGEIAVATIRNFWKPIRLFLEMNDINLAWKKISRGIPKGRKFAVDRAPTIDEIRKLVEYPDRRIKAIVYTMCSSGIRLGAWEYLKWNHVTPIEREGMLLGAKLLVYAEDEEQYFTFITPEAYNELKKWMDFRRECGEKVTDESKVLRDLLDAEKFGRGLVRLPKELKASGIKSLIEGALKSQGIRKKLPVGKKRHEFQADHGFRKFFKTRAEQAMKPINVETLIGHSTGISDSYYRPNENELFSDYLNAIPELTISTESKLEAEKFKAVTERNHFQTENKEIHKQYTTRIDNLEKTVKRLVRKIERQNTVKPNNES